MFFKRFKTVFKIKKPTTRTKHPVVAPTSAPIKIPFVKSGFSFPPELPKLSEPSEFSLPFEPFEPSELPELPELPGSSVLYTAVSVVCFVTTKVYSLSSQTMLPFSSCQPTKTCPFSGDFARTVTVSPTTSLPPPVPPTTAISTFSIFLIVISFISTPFSSKCFLQNSQSLCAFTPSFSSVAGTSFIHSPNLCAFSMTSALSSVIICVAFLSKNFVEQTVHL